MEAMDRVAPGFRQRLDQLVQAPQDPKLAAIIQEQNHLLASHGKLLSQPESRLSASQQKEKARLNQRLEALSAAYDKVDGELSQRANANLKQAQELGSVFLHRLRKNARVSDVSDRVRIDSSATERLKQNGIATETFLHWVNEFHHQTGLPAPQQLKFRYCEERPNYDSSTDSINIGDKFSKRMALHEIAHRLEYKHPEISLANKSWVAARCQKGGFSNQPVALQSLVPKGKYGPTELALEDSFVDPYVGKVYPDMATEVLSMGLEHFADEKRWVKLYQQDPEHLFLTLGALQTLSQEGW
jgi:hypothetical protein